MRQFSGTEINLSFDNYDMGARRGIPIAVFLVAASSANDKGDFPV